MVSAEGGTPQQYIGEAEGSSFQFSPDGKYLSFTRKYEKKEQLYLVPTSGGEAVRLTSHRGGIGFYQWSKDGKKIFFSAEETLSDEEKKEHDLGADPIFIDEGPNGKNEGHWENFWVFNIETKREARITNEEILVQRFDTFPEGFDISPDGNRIVFGARKENRVNTPYLSELYLVDVRTKKVTRLTNNKTLEMGPLWAPDGKAIIYQATKREDYYDYTNGYFWIINPDTGEKRRIQDPSDGEVSSITWMPDGKSILFSERKRTNQNLYRMDISSGEITQLTNVTGSLSGFVFSKDRKQMVFSFSDYKTPSDLYSSSVKNYKPVRLTNLNPWIEKEILLADAEVIRWKSRDDFEIEGVFYLPGDYKQGAKLPLMLTIHGGPQWHFGNEFDAVNHIFGGLGYATLEPNVRGSTGYGDKLLRGLIGQVGDGEFVDQMTGVDEVIKRGYVDPDQLGIRGWSWGGVSTSYTITQTQRFKAAKVGAGVTNWAAEVGPGFSYDVGLWFIGGKPWTNPDSWRKHSSITHVENISTATLIIHGAEDQKSSVGQSLMLFTAIKDIGKAPVRYIKFPRQGHGIHEPRLQRIDSIEEIKWMQKYIRGIEWEPWKRK
jgi:dipeptidyl aminopeptidase/acylaminoacyl peptidase